MKIDPAEERELWAEECDTPAHKLVLVYVDAASFLVNDRTCGNESGLEVTVSRPALAKACGLDRETATSIVLDLHRDGRIHVAAYTAEEFDIELGSLDQESDPEGLGIPHRESDQGDALEPGELALQRQPRAPWETSGYRLRSRLWAAQAGACWYCGCKLAVHEAHWARTGKGGRHNGWHPIEGYHSPMIEHQTPRSRGGGDDRQNKVLSCALCNTRKADRRVEEFRELCEQKGWPSPVVFHGEKLVARSTSPKSFLPDGEN